MPVEIADWNDLDNVRNDLTGDYVLVNDLDSETDGYAGIGDDFEPIGDFGEFDGMGVPFEGTFDGDGFAIEDLVIDFQENGVGLFGYVDNSNALIENVSVSGSVSDNNADDFRTGGLVGFNNNGTIQNCVSHVDVVASNDDVGGLVGENADIVTNCYATGSVEADQFVGGLVGTNFTTVTESYATGSVEGDNGVGGLVGNDSFGAGTTEDSYWDTETTGQDSSFGGTGLTTAEMQGSEAETNMDGFDFADVWSTVEGDIDIDFETINGQITLDDVAVETGTVILHNFSEPESVGGLSDGYPILLSVDEDEQLESQNAVVRNIARTETDTNGNYSADIPGATGDTIAIAVDFDDGTERYGRVVTTVLE